MQEAFPRRPGSDLVVLRKHLGVEQQAIAGKLQRHRSTLSRWETKGDRIPGDGTVSALTYTQYEAACRAVLEDAARVEALA